MRLAIALLLSVSTGLTAVQAPARADITFAVVGGMSGPFEKIGSWFRNGARGAVEAINQDGGLVGETVTFIVRDDECNPDKAVAIAKEIVDIDIPFVMGHLCSDASIAAADLYEKNGVIAISPASTNPKLTDRGMTNIFRTTGRDDVSMVGFRLRDVASTSDSYAI